MATRNTSNSSAARKGFFWVAFTLTWAALGFAAMLTWKAIQGPGAPDMKRHFAIVAESAGDDDDSDGDSEDLSEPERAQLEEALRGHGVGASESRRSVR